MAYKFWQQKKILILLAVLALFLLAQTAPFSRFFTALAAPVFKSGSLLYKLGVKAREGWTGLTGGFALQKKVAAQAEEIADLARANADLASLAAVKEELRDLWQWREGRSANIIPADVLFFSQALNRQTLLIGRGQKDGLAPGYAVVARSGVLVGKISRVYEDMAAVLLITDGQSTVAARPAGASEVQAIVRGKLGVSLIMELIPQDTALAAGDLVVTSALEENTPPGLVVGRVASVLYREGELFKRANLEPMLANINLRSVGVIVPPAL